MLNAIGIEEYQSKVILTNIEHSSILLFISNVISKTGDKEIKNKGLIAFGRQFLIEAKKPFFNYASKHEKLEKKDDLRTIKQEIVTIARSNKIENTVLLEGLSDDQIFSCLESYSVPSENLGQHQKYTAICNGEKYLINRNFNPDKMLLEESIREFKNITLDLKPKKTCYVGDSQWEFLNVDGIAIKAKIGHKEWLKNFQKNTLPANEYPFPTTVLRVTGDFIVKKDSSGFKKDISAHITKVHGVVRHEKDFNQRQIRLLD